MTDFITAATETLQKNTPLSKPAVPAYANPATLRGQEIAHDAAQQGVGANATDGFKNTAVASAGRVVADEAPGLYTEITGEAPSFGVTNAPARVAASVMSLVGLRAGKADYDKASHVEALTKDIPFEYHDEIMDNDNLAAAQRARARIVADTERGRRMAQQDDGQLTMMAASMFDADLPLSFMTGGAFWAAKIAKAGRVAARGVGLGERGAVRLSSVLMGANAGAQAGALVGAVDASQRETAGWQDFAAMTFQGALMGTAGGAAVTGEARLSYTKAHEDFLRRVATDDPAYRGVPDIDRTARAQDDLKQFVPGEGSTVGALQVNGVPGAAPLSASLTDPAGDLSPTNKTWIDGANEWRHNTGWADRKQDIESEAWTKLATHPAANMTTSFYNNLYTSKSAVANWFGGAVFESPSGLGRDGATAATRAEVYHKRIMGHLARDVSEAANAFAKETGTTFRGSGFGINQEGLEAFNREVILELNSRNIGVPSTGRNQHVIRAADKFDAAGKEAHGIGRGKHGETSIDGFENLPEKPGYTPQHWSGRKITQALKSGRVTQDDIVTALSSGYMTAGMRNASDIAKISKAVVQRAISKEADIDSSVWSLLSGDGQEFLRQSLTMSGVKAADADAILDRLVGKKHEQSKEGFAKSRNEIDLSGLIQTRDGSKMQIVDLLDTDLTSVWQRYSRRLSGSAALARVGIVNRAERNEVIAAMRAEQRALGEEPMDADHMHAMLSHFNGGPVHGFAFGQTNEGIGVPLSLAKKAAGLALLEKLGITQLAETGADIAQQGLLNWAHRGPMALFDKELKAGNKALLDDVAFLTGAIGKDHLLFVPYMDLDDALPSDTGYYLRTAQKFLSNAQWVQGYTSLFNQIKGWQQQTAVLGLSDKVFRTLKASMDSGTPLDAAVLKRFQDDLGLGQDTLNDLENLINNGTIEFKTVNGVTFVDKLNTHTWDHDLGDTFASAVTRNVNQIVQKTLAGEEDAWMHTQAGSLFTHLKSFPLAAIQKQVIRNGRHMDGQGLATLMYGMATAYAAVRIKDAIDGKERTQAEYAKLAFNYSNMTGFIPMGWDPLMTIVGLEDMRFNQYGPYSDITPPVISVANNMRRIPGALAHVIGGTPTWHHEQALKALPFAGTYGVSGMFDNIAGPK